MKKEITNIGLVLLVCGTIFASSHNLGKVRPTMSNSETIQNSISVSGEGKVMATPDIVRIRAGISETRKTTKAAQEAANQKIKNILDILEKHDIAEKNIQTANLSFDEEYDWSSDKRKVIGQRVRQNLNVKISDIINNPAKVTDILDELGSVDGLELNSVTFDIENKKEFFTKARAEAFAKAQQKAEELAELGDVKLLKPISISESNYSYVPPVYSNIARAEMSFDTAGGSALPTGELEVSASIEIVFGIE